MTDTRELQPRLEGWMERWACNREVTSQITEIMDESPCPTVAWDVGYARRVDALVAAAISATLKRETGVVGYIEESELPVTGRATIHQSPNASRVPVILAPKGGKKGVKMVNLGGEAGDGLSDVGDPILGAPEPPEDVSPQETEMDEEEHWELFDLVRAALPYPHQLANLKAEGDAIRFDWRHHRYQVVRGSPGYGPFLVLDVTGKDVRASTHTALIFEALLAKTATIRRLEGEKERLKAQRDVVVEELKRAHALLHWGWVVPLGPPRCRLEAYRLVETLKRIQEMEDET